MTKQLSIAILAGALSIGVFAPAMAAENLGKFSQWVAWKDQDSTGKICYISSQPQSTQPTDVIRSAIHFIVTHRMGTGKRNEVATNIGYPFDTSKTATASIDGREYAMVTADESAWLAATADEPGFVAAMKAGSTMVVKGTSTRGTNTTDTYSLSGVTAAMGVIDKECAQ
ncbi:invasion associated locus B family protein [Cucumibacter marinus]|uniref:invasion associated locus B family protein n=1 Tax=Cucumibacter marinus TaxID=1121252 RepID=UPI0004077E2F|nr:invasion associated locus B family protein [Cucumibacter marinus]